MRRIAPPVLLLLLCIGFYWRLTLSVQYSFLNRPDLAKFDFQRLHEQAAEWRHLRMPGRDLDQWGGQALLGHWSGVAYPVNWLVGFAGFSGCFVSVLAVPGLETEPGGVDCGGVTLSSSGFMANTEWPQILNGAVWLPLVVLFLFRTVRGKRPVFSEALAGALVVAWQILLAQEYAPLARRWAGLVVPRPRVHIDPFMGVLGFSLAVLGVVAGWRRWRWRWCG